MQLRCQTGLVDFHVGRAVEQQCVTSLQDHLTWGLLDTFTTTSYCDKHQTIILLKGRPAYALTDQAATKSNIGSTKLAA